ERSSGQSPKGQAGRVLVAVQPASFDARCIAESGSFALSFDRCVSPLGSITPTLLPCASRLAGKGDCAECQAPASIPKLGVELALREVTQGGPVSLDAQTCDHAAGNGTEVAVVAEGLAGMNVRN